MEKIQKLSCTLKKIFQILAIASPILICLQWLLIDWQPVKTLVQMSMILKPVITPEGLVNFAEIAMSSTSKLVALFGNLLGATPYILGYILLHKLFSNYQHGQIFNKSNPAIFQKLGRLILINGILIIPLKEGLMVVAATLNSPPGHRYLTLSFGTPNLEATLCGLLVIVISWVMQEGQAIQEENQLTV
ncbi:MAG: DUF2975 domain-containing protein [Proteobacteria bacterium]|nr:DUF2975 domain-containing protein [Pseudomonadota bacterium]